MLISGVNAESGCPDQPEARRLIKVFAVDILNPMILQSTTTISLLRPLEIKTTPLFRA